MFRPRSLNGLSSWPADTKLVVPSYSPSPNGEDKDDYSGAKMLDVPAHKRVKSHLFYLHYKLAACINHERVGQTAALLVLLLLTVGLWLLHAHMVQQATQPRHLVILDAGSTGTRVHVFKYSADARSSYAVLKLPEPKLKVEPGLSSYVSNAAGAGASLRPLLKFAEQHVPAQQRASTPVYLMATAGLRLVPAAAAASILEQCRAVLSASAFLFEPERASIISGKSEGLYGWIAANYAAGTLQAAVRNLRSRKEPKEPPSASFKTLIEMGGASAQVTFVPEPSWRSSRNSSSRHSTRLQLPGVTQPVWSHSYLGYGFDVVEKKVLQLVRQRNQSASNSTGGFSTSSAAGAGSSSKQQQQRTSGGHKHQPVVQSPVTGSSGHVIMDPCLPAGYTSNDGRTGSGDWYQCQALVAQAIDPSRCKAAAHAVSAVAPAAEATCPELPEDMPKLTGEMIAVENFAYTAHAMNLPEHSSLGDFAAAARAFCSRPFPQTLHEHSKQPDQQRYLWRYCFGSAFGWTLLHDVLHLGEGQQLRFSNTLRSSTTGEEVGLDWALGAAVQLLSKHGDSEGVVLKQQRQVVLLVLLAAVVATATLGFAASVSAVRFWTAAKARKMRFSDDETTTKGVLKFRVPQHGIARHIYRTLPVSTSIRE